MVLEIHYSDGSANAYRFVTDGDGATFVYDPVTPERSSTGMYSGGPPRAGRLDAVERAALWQHVRALETATALHVTDRGKGTGLFVITDTSGSRSFIIARGSELAAFDAFASLLR